MTKAELIDAVATKAGTTKTDTAKVLNAFCETVQATDKVTLVGFGTFAYKTRAARAGRNPQTGEAIQIAASRTLTFKASKTK